MNNSIPVILVEGWRFLIHSYSTVMIFQLIEFVRNHSNKYKFYVKELRYYRNHWVSDKKFTIFPPEFKKILLELEELPKGVVPDLIYRLAFPYLIDGPRDIPRLVFYRSQKLCT